jgi:hypothetical protein
MEDSIFISEKLKDNANLGIEQQDECARFRLFENLIKPVLMEHEDGVFIKLNWWAPKDCASWAVDLRFNNLHDILLALKSSGWLMEMLGDYREWCDGEAQLASYPKTHVHEN